MSMNGYIPLPPEAQKKAEQDYQYQARETIRTNFPELSEAAVQILLVRGYQGSLLEAQTHPGRLFKGGV